MKTKQIVVRQFDELKFIVVSGRDQVDYLPGEFIARSAVKTLCQSNSWRVKIIASSSEEKEDCKHD